MGLSLLVGTALIILILLPPIAQEPKETEPQEPWTGKLADGREITQADLDKIIQEHHLWVIRREGQREGQQLSLSGARLVEADLRGALLVEANMSGALLVEANMSGANLNKANLSGANLNEAYLSGARLSEADLSGARLVDANLSGAWLVDANLSRAILSRADLSGAVFEPKPGSLSDVSLLLNIEGLASLRYEESSHGLVELREAYKKAGLREPERQVTFALNHTRREKLWEQGGLLGKLESLFHLVCFEWTCQYGMSPGRSLQIIGLALLFFTVPYMFALRSRKRETGIWVVLLPDRVLNKNVKDRPVKLTLRNPFLPPLEGRGVRLRSTIQRLLGVLWVGFHFSLLSAFSLGWRELNVGNWITRIQKREYTLRATGWVRAMAGLQSLLSAYMLALWVLTYFGRPFD